MFLQQLTLLKLLIDIAQFELVSTSKPQRLGIYMAIETGMAIDVASRGTGYIMIVKVNYRRRISLQHEMSAGHHNYHVYQSKRVTGWSHAFCIVCATGKWRTYAIVIEKEPLLILGLNGWGTHPSLSSFICYALEIWIDSIEHIRIYVNTARDLRIDIVYRVQKWSGVTAYRIRVGHSVLFTTSHEPIWSI